MIRVAALIACLVGGSVTALYGLVVPGMPWATVPFGVAAYAIAGLWLLRISRGTL